MPDIIRFSDMKNDHPLQLNGANDLLAIAVVSGGTETGYNSMTTTPNQLGQHTVIDQEFANFTTTAKTVQGAINELKENGGGHTYSSDEQEVGTWIDGSTIYEKTLHFTDVTIQAGNNVSFPMTDYISNMKQVISFNGCCSTNDGYNTTYVVLPYEGMWNGTEWSLLIACDSVNIVITRAAPSGSHHLSDIYVTLQYTKNAS